MKCHRPYQQAAVTAILGSVGSGGKNGLLCLPTGSGKTFVAMSAIRAISPSSVLWVAHRKELFDQASAEAKSHGLSCGYPWDGDFQITLCPIMSRHKLTRDEYDIVVIDEVHHVASASYLDLLGTVKYDYCLGLSATPERLDKKPLGFSKVLYQVSMLELINQGYLAKPVYYRISTGIPVSLVTRDGDFTRASLRTLDREDRNRTIIDWLANNDSGPTLVFAVDVEHARTLSSLATDAGMDTQCLSADSSDDERSSVRTWFESSKKPVLVNCELFTEGMDLPSIRTVVLARPTASKTLYSQAIGRGSRLCEGKTKFNIVDVVDMSAKYATLSATWVLDIDAELAGDADQIAEQAEMLKLQDLRKSARELADGINISVRLVPPVLEMADFSGFLTYGSKFKSKHTTTAVTKAQYKALSKLNILLDEGTSVDGTYILANPDREFGFKEWVAIAWARVFHDRGLLDFGTAGNLTWRWAAFGDAVHLDDAVLRSEIAYARYRIETMPAIPLNRLWQLVEERARSRYGRYTEIRSFTPRRFQNMVLELNCNGSYRDRMVIIERRVVEAAVEEVLGQVPFGIKVRYMK